MTINIAKIEMMGLPGSGKTYLGRKMAEEQSGHFVEIRNRRERYFYGVLFILLHPILFFSYIKLILEQYKLTRHPGLKHKIFFILLKACAAEGKSLFYSKGVIDEGLYQFIISLYEKEMSVTELEYNLSLLKKLKRDVYFLHSEKKDRIARMESRGRQVRVGYNSDYLEQFTEVYEKNASLILEYFSNSKEVRLINN